MEKHSVVPIWCNYDLQLTAFLPFFLLGLMSWNWALTSHVFHESRVCALYFRGRSAPKAYMSLPWDLLFCFWGIKGFIFFFPSWRLCSVCVHRNGWLEAFGLLCLAQWTLQGSFILPSSSSRCLFPFILPPAQLHWVAGFSLLIYAWGKAAVF